jgi:hypothetical protein
MITSPRFVFAAPNYYRERYCLIFAKAQQTSYKKKNYEALSILQSIVRLPVKSQDTDFASKTGQKTVISKPNPALTSSVTQATIKLVKSKF